MNALITRYYGSDKAVAGDAELQEFAKDASDPKQGNVKGFPSSFKTIQDLSSALAHLQVLTTVGHASANYKTVGYQLALPGSPSKFLKALPKKLGTVTKENILEWLPTPKDAISVMRFSLGFARPLAGMSSSYYILDIFQFIRY